MIWGVIRRRVVSSTQKVGLATSAQRCHRTMPKEVLCSRKAFQQIQSSSYYISIGGRDNSSTRRNLADRFQTQLIMQSRSRMFSSDNGHVVEAVVPFMGESITDGTLAKFLKNPGDKVEVDEPIAQIETDKVTIDVVSPESGTIQKFLAKEGETVEPGTKIAVISKSGEGVVTHVAPSEKFEAQAAPPKDKETVEKREHKEEAAAFKEKINTPSPPKSTAKAPPPPPSKPTAQEPQLPPKDRERRVPMTRLRKRVATRLKDSQNTFAMLTTFNEVDM